jgi:beta-glucosidase
MKYWIVFPIFIVLVAMNCKNARKMKDSKSLPPLAVENTRIIAGSEKTIFRDLNHNGELDVYEDINQPVESRIEDLLGQMTLEEKAGMMFINGAAVNDDATLDKKEGAVGPAELMPAAADNIAERKMNHFNIWEIPDDPGILAKWHNNLQRFAEATRLGIPVSIASDPRHHFSNQIFSMSAVGFSQFCETLGLAAIRDENLMKEFGEIVRREYLAVGIRIALHPQIDLATEPRWSRISGTFGEDAELSAKMVKAYLAGMQGEELSETSIACMTKHFPGGGPQKEGLDPHFEFQKGQIYPGNNFNYHLIPFEAAIDAGTASIMPYYGVPVGQTDEDVAMSYNKSIITDLLRKNYEYDGVICTDWGLVTDFPMGPGIIWPARAWGVEHLNESERVLKIIEAGCDQFGGESRPELVVDLVKNGKLKETRIDESVRRLLRQKFQLGLFDNPFVDENKVRELVGKAGSVKLGEESQQRSMTLLKNPGGVLPLEKNKHKIFAENLDSTVLARYATVVKTPEEAELAIIRLNTPWYPAETENPIARGFHHGDLDFKESEKARILSILKSVPTVVDIYLDRPAVIPGIAAEAAALIADYGASDLSVCEVLFGNARPEGRLPFELPSSMDAVRNQKTDLPYDSENPLYGFGHGLKYDR